MPFSALALCATFLVVISTAQTAERSTFVELPYGLIIGAHSAGKWLTSEQAGKALEPGGKYRLFTLEGKAGEAIGGKPAPNADVCPDVWPVPRPEIIRSCSCAMS